MFRSLSLAFLLVLAPNVLAENCKLETGRYVIAGGSEFHTALDFSSDGTVVLEHENWIPGQYQDRRRWTIAGTWSCRNFDVSLLLGKEECSAKLVSVGRNPLGIEEDALVLQFVDTGKVDYLLDGAVFYEEHLLE